MEAKEWKWDSEVCRKQVGDEDVCRKVSMAFRCDLFGPVVAQTSLG